jgi:hypothetical protein
VALDLAGRGDEERGVDDGLAPRELGGVWVSDDDRLEEPRLIDHRCAPTRLHELTRNDPERGGQTDGSEGALARKLDLARRVAPIDPPDPPRRRERQADEREPQHARRGATEWLIDGGSEGCAQEEARPRSFASCSFLRLIIGAQQEPEHEHVSDQEQRYHERRNEVGGSQLTGVYAHTDAALIVRVQQICRAPKIEDPDEGDPEPARKRSQREQRQNRRTEISVRRGTREGGRQIRRDDSGHQERQADEPEAVESEQRPQGVDT